MKPVRSIRRNIRKEERAADKPSADVADARQKKLQADALETSRLRDLRLAKEAADTQAAREAKAAKGKTKRKAAN